MGLVSYRPVTSADNPAPNPPPLPSASGLPGAPPLRFPAWRAAYVLLALAGLGLAAVPALDLAVSGWFYVPGAGFPADHSSSYHSAVRVAVRVIVIAFTVFAGAGLAWSLLRGQRFFGLGAAACAYLLLVLALGPGVVVNGVFKNHWDRARPSQIMEFGGRKSFSRAGVISDQCPKNCAFVSGDASVGFVLGAFGFAAAIRRRGRRRRRRAHLGFAAGAVAGAWIGFTRVAQGGHFLSDVIFAGVVVIGIAWLLARALEKWRPRLPALFRDP